MSSCAERRSASFLQKSEEPVFGVKTEKNDDSKAEEQELPEWRQLAQRETTLMSNKKQRTEESDDKDDHPETGDSDIPDWRQYIQRESGRWMPNKKQRTGELDDSRSTSVDLSTSAGGLSKVSP